MEKDLPIKPWEQRLEQVSVAAARASGPGNRRLAVTIASWREAEEGEPCFLVWPEAQDEDVYKTILPAPSGVRSALSPEQLNFCVGFSCSQ